MLVLVNYRVDNTAIKQGEFMTINVGGSFEGNIHSGDASNEPVSGGAEGVDGGVPGGTVGGDEAASADTEPFLESPLDDLLQAMQEANAAGEVYAAVEERAEEEIARLEKELKELEEASQSAVSREDGIRWNLATRFAEEAAEHPTIEKIALLIATGKKEGDLREYAYWLATALNTLQESATQNTAVMRIVAGSVCIGRITEPGLRLTVSPAYQSHKPVDISISAQGLSAIPDDPKSRSLSLPEVKPLSDGVKLEILDVLGVLYTLEDVTIDKTRSAIIGNEWPLVAIGDNTIRRIIELAVRGNLISPQLLHAMSIAAEQAGVQLVAEEDQSLQATVEYRVNGVREALQTRIEEKLYETILDAVHGTAPKLSMRELLAIAYTIESIGLRVEQLQTKIMDRLIRAGQSDKDKDNLVDAALRLLRAVYPR